jgi:eukaryotic-like serine/threonine-protein kinase
VAEQVPARLGHYEVRGSIGEGGMATVYLGLNHSHDRASDGDRVVALKVIKPLYAMNTEFVTMFTDEAKLVSQLKHPNIVEVYELGAEGNRLFMAMEFLHGQSLWHIWNACRERGIRLRYDVAAWIGARVAEGLHHAHESVDARGNPLGIVHRDVNASNIFVTYDGRVKVIDFGLARVANRLSQTRAGMVKGKLAYMSPEQAIGRLVDRRTDIFALGTTLWEVTVDRRLFKADDDAKTMEQVHAARIPNPMESVEGYPEGLWNVLRRALNRDPNLRFRDAADMSVAFDRVSMSEGRTVNESVMSGIMHALFEKERAAQNRWLEEARASSTMVEPMLRPERLSEAMFKMEDLPAAPASLMMMSSRDFAPSSERIPVAEATVRDSGAFAAGQSGENPGLSPSASMAVAPLSTSLTPRMPSAPARPVEDSEALSAAYPTPKEIKSVAPPGNLRVLFAAIVVLIVLLCAGLLLMRR